MEVLGAKIRKARKKQRMSQTTLAEGICTQATVSKIENKNQCESLVVFSAICTKLGLTVSDCLEESYEQKLIRILNDVEALCEKVRHEEAYDIICAYNFEEKLVSYSIKIKFLYYRGLTSLLGKSNCEEAQIYLNQSVKVNKEPTIYNILGTNALGILYQLQENWEQAKIYNERAYRMVSNFSKEELPAIACKLFYNLAKYYSALKNYERSILLCDEGIRLSKEKHTTFGLDALLYEKAYNEYFLNGDTESYKMAYYFSEFANRVSMKRCLEKEFRKYNIKLQ